MSYKSHIKKVEQAAIIGMKPSSIVKSPNRWLFYASSSPKQSAVSIALRKSVKSRKIQLRHKLAWSIGGTNFGNHRVASIYSS